ncbi:MAG TPA: NrfD/PsrC family molybdoenzyme membrane anchor subunit [Rubrobacteraceae bacterium]|nr:NrfD/PsrC family molybdoenzyme membrane anchor subunit [Rubrobacteraceae bacterium]
MAETTRETPQQRNGHVETSHHPRTDSERRDQGYYGIPPIKEHTWTWEVPVYFWLGGIGSGAHVVNVIARLVGHDDKALIRAGRYTTLICMLLSPLLLISDLGRPERFYNMLRIAKWRSPMSMGTWGLSAFASLSGLVAASQAAEDGLLGRQNFLARLLSALPDRLIGTLAAPFGVFVGAYTGLLIALTSTPIWARNAVLMGPLFLASAMSTGLSAISFVLHLFGAGQEKTLEGLRRAEKSSLLLEGGLLAASLYQMGPWGKPLRTGKVGAWFFGGTVVSGLLAPFVLLQGRESRGRGLIASLLVLIGGYILRRTIIDAGKLSARDPQATFTFARQENLPLRDENV